MTRSSLERLIGTLWVCESCYFTHVNGECGEIPDGYPEPLSDVQGLELAAGMSAIEHDAAYCLIGFIADAERQYPDLDWPDVPGGCECECEIIDFSHSPCAGCGDHHYGTRYAMTAWETE